MLSVKLTETFSLLGLDLSSSKVFSLVITTENAMNQATANVSKEKLLDDFSEVVTEAEQLVKSVSGDKANALFARMEQNLRLAKERLGDLQEVTVKKTKAAAQATDNYVHENPWKAICVAAGLGILIGLLLNRR
jgi:ElaB/YqjD/DUF883 family membrane-anchored ribosome-binding protein